MVNCVQNSIRIQYPLFQLLFTTFCLLIDFNSGRSSMDRVRLITD